MAEMPGHHQLPGGVCWNANPIPVVVSGMVVMQQRLGKSINGLVSADVHTMSVLFCDLSVAWSAIIPRNS